MARCVTVYRVPGNSNIYCEHDIAVYSYDVNSHSIIVLCSKKTDTFISSENICKDMEKYETNFMKQKIH